MKKLLSVILLSTLAFGAQAKDAAKPAVNVADTAKAVAALMPLEDQVNEFTQTVAANLPEEKRALFTSIMKKNVDVKLLRAAAAEALIKTYTPAELENVKTMYAQPGSKAVIEKLDEFAVAMQPAIETLVGKGLEEAKKAGVVE